METVDLQNCSWVMLIAEGWKHHYVHKSLLAGLMEDAGVRGHESAPAIPVQKGLIDLPGMIMTDRGLQSIKIDSFELRIPFSDFEYFHMMLSKNPERAFANGQKYYKIHGWLHCIVFTPEQRKLVLAAMDDILPEIKRKADEETQEFTRRIKDINRGGVKIITPKDPESLKVVQQKSPLSGTPNGEVN